jgi:hypothetical protein
MGEDGWSLARIGERLGVDGETVRRAFLRSGIETRPRSGCKPNSSQKRDA